MTRDYPNNPGTDDSVGLNIVSVPRRPKRLKKVCQGVRTPSGGVDHLPGCPIHLEGPHDAEDVSHGLSTQCAEETSRQFKVQPPNTIEAWKSKHGIVTFENHLSHLYEEEDEKPWYLWKAMPASFIDNPPWNIGDSHWVHGVRWGRTELEACRRVATLNNFDQPPITQHARSKGK